MTAEGPLWLDWLDEEPDEDEPEEDEPSDPEEDEPSDPEEDEPSEPEEDEPSEPDEPLEDEPPVDEEAPDDESSDPDDVVGLAVVLVRCDAAVAEALAPSEPLPAMTPNARTKVVSVAAATRRRIVLTRSARA